MTKKTKMFFMARSWALFYLSSEEKMLGKPSKKQKAKAQAQDHLSLDLGSLSDIAEP